MSASARVALRGRLVDQLTGAPLTGALRIVDAAGQVVSTTLAGTGAFSVDVPRPAGNTLTLTDSDGRTYGVDVSGTTPTVQATPSGGRLLLQYGGDPDMQDQTPDTIAAQARADSVSAQATAAAAQAAVVTMSATLSLLMTSMQAALAGAQAAQGRKVGLVLGRAAVPNLAVGVEKAVPVTWTPPPPVTPSSTLLLFEPTGSLLGQVSATLKPDSVTATGATVLLKAPLSIATAAGSVVVVGAYLA